MPALCRFFCEKNMAIQIPNLGTAPAGAGGDTSRSAMSKIINNFSNNTNAASRLVGTASGNVMEVGAFGLGAGALPTYPDSFTEQVKRGGGFYYTPNSTGLTDGQMLVINRGYWLKGLHFPVNNTPPRFLTTTNVSTSWSSYDLLVSGLNTAVDSNGFIKKASPIVQLFADKIELNDEAKEQNPVFEKVGVGDYLVKNTKGFSDDGWYIETPKDANGNVLFSVVYKQLNNNDISIKTYKKKFDLETASIIADLDKPIDITDGRFISLRLQELPQDDTESIAPPDFQPTNLSQAISEMMSGSQQ